MLTASNSLQTAVYAIIFLLLAYVAYSYFTIKKAHAGLFGLGMLFLALSFASWACAIQLWTNPFIEYRNLSYVLQLAAILTFLGCSVSLAPKRYQKLLNWAVIGIAAIVAIYLTVSPMLNGAFIYSLRFYLSFQNEPTIIVFAVLLALSLIMAVFSLNHESDKVFKLDFRSICFVVLALCLAIGFSSYSDYVRNINIIVLLIDSVLLAISHTNILPAKK